MFDYGAVDKVIVVIAAREFDLLADAADAALKQRRQQWRSRVAPVLLLDVREAAARLNVVNLERCRGGSSAR
jgi:hypothetical protein